MKKRFLKGFASLVLLAGTAACSDGVGLGFGQGDGKIALTTEIDASVASARSSRAEYTDVTPADLSIRLTSDDGSFSQTWDGVAAFPVDHKFKVGTYTIEAFYGDENTEGFESPAFYGSQTIRVEEGLTTPVHLTAGVANSLVTINYTDNFKDYMTSYTAELHSAGGSYIEYNADETRPAYVKAGTVEVSVDFMKPNGVGGKLKVASFEAVAARHYNVMVDLGGDGAGAATIIITLDEYLNEEPLSINISDEVLNAPAPTVAADGFVDGTAVEFVPGQPFEKGFKFNIIAPAGIGEVSLTTQSASLLAKNWPAEVELIGASEAVRSTVASLGLTARGLFKNPDKLGVVDLTGVLANIAYLNSGNNTTTFTLLVTDRAGKQSDPVTLIVEARQVKMNIVNPILYVGSSALTFDLEFNAGDPAALVRFEYANRRGTRTVFTPMVEKTGDNLYRLTADIVSGDVDLTAPLELYATCEGIGTVNLTIERSPAVVVDSRSSVNSFAKSAYIPVTIGEKDSDTDLFNRLLSNSTVMLSTDGANFSEVPVQAFSDAKMLYITGLQPSTSYIVKVKNGSQDYASAPSVKFTTEAASQIPNGDLDADVTIAASGSNWENVVFQGWGTNNPMTTSQGSDLGYTRISGTKQVDGDDAHNGEGKAVRIRTNGWGSGNSALTGVRGACKYIDAGLLHLGASRSVRPDGYGDRSGSLLTDDLDCGIAFASRPSSLSFWYKYEVKNSADHGEALVQVIDAEGNIIAQGVRDLGATGSYTEVIIPLSYAVAPAKACKIYVRFLSTNVSSALAKDSNWLNGPGLGNLARGEYYGSSLFIDDIVLNY